MLLIPTSLGSTCIKLVEQAASGVWLKAAGVLTHHVGAGTGKRHELGVELQAGDRPCVLSIQHSHLHAALCIPHVDLSVLRAWSGKTFDCHKRTELAQRCHSYWLVSHWFSNPCAPLPTRCEQDLNRMKRFSYRS